MKKKVNSNKKIVWMVIGAVVLFVLMIFLISSLFNGVQLGNVAVIPVNGMITGDGGNYLGSSTTSSQTVVSFIEQAEENVQVKAILLEINSPGGSPVATDEVVAAVKKAEKPVIAVIREVGASGGYWIASAADYVIANRMSLTGSIGVFSSFLEFSGLMEQYGVGYERINSGEYKDLGVPFRKLEENERKLLQSRADLFHDFFIAGVAENRGLSEEKVREVATGAAFLGVEALNYGLVDELGNKDTAEDYLKKRYGLKKIEYVVYKKEVTLFDVFAGGLADFSFKVGEGLGAIMLKRSNDFLLI